MNSAKITIQADAAPLLAAMQLLAEFAQHSREVVQGFLGGLDSLSQLVRLDSDNASTPGAGECWVVFQPSDLLVEFLLATGTGECDVL